jgi:hypothetical protein
MVARPDAKPAAQVTGIVGACEACSRSQPMTACSAQSLFSSGSSRFFIVAFLVVVAAARYMNISDRPRPPFLCRRADDSPVAGSCRTRHLSANPDPVRDSLRWETEARINRVIGLDARMISRPLPAGYRCATSDSDIRGHGGRASSCSVSRSTELLSESSPLWLFRRPGRRAGPSRSNGEQSAGGADPAARWRGGGAVAHTGGAI